MDLVVEKLREVVREVLGDSPSELFYQRVDRTLDEAAGDAKRVTEACRRVQSMVNLFIDVGKAEELGRRFERICGPEASNGRGLPALGRNEASSPEEVAAPRKKGLLF